MTGIKLNNYIRVEKPKDTSGYIAGFLLPCNDQELFTILGMPDDDDQRWLQRVSDDEYICVFRMADEIDASILGRTLYDADAAGNWLTNLIDRHRMNRLLIDIPEHLRDEPYNTQPDAEAIDGRIYYAVAYPAKLLRFDSPTLRNKYISDNDHSISVSFVQARSLVMGFATDASQWVMDLSAKEFKGQVFRRKCEPVQLLEINENYPGKTLQ